MGFSGRDDGQADDVAGVRLALHASVLGADDGLDRVQAAAAAGRCAGAHPDLGDVGRASANRLANGAVRDSVALADHHGDLATPRGSPIEPDERRLYTSENENQCHFQQDRWPKMEIGSINSFKFRYLKYLAA